MSALLLRALAPAWVPVWVLAAAVAARAQPPFPPPTFELPEVEVPGKRPQLPSTTPASISVITREEIDRIGAVTVADALRVLPEVRVKQSGGPGSLTTVSIRGSTSPQVLILVDGVPINRPDQGSVDLSTFPVQNVERIEVLRGPFSALYGSAALGGVINIVTRTGPETAVSTRIGSYGFDAYTLSLGGRIQNLTYLFQGILDTGGAFAPDTDFSDLTGTAKFRWQAAPDSSVTLTVNRLRHDTGAPGPLPFQDLLARLAERRTLVDLAWRRGAVDGPGAFARLYVLNDDVSFTSPATAFQSEDTANLWGAQAQVVLAPWPGHLLTAGAEYQGQTIGHTDNVPAPFANQGYDLALYLEDDWQIAPPVLLSLGVRGDTFQQWGTQIDPRLGVVAVLTDRLIVRAGVGRTFRAPTFDELAPSLFGNPALQPETAWSGDLGLEYRFAPDLTVSLTGYHTDATNLIVSAPPFFIPLNVGHAIVEGASAELLGRLGDRWFVRANVTVQRARDAATGLDVIYVPRQQANLEVSYAWAPGSAITAVVTYQSDRFTDAANTMSLPAYWLVGINASWALGDGLSVEAGVTNLFNIAYQETAGFPEPGRVIYAGFAKRF
jgi:vitamin B12 transporter